VNARDAMPFGGRLLIETRNVLLDQALEPKHCEAAPGPAILLTVTDTGVGMNQATLQRIFEPFFTMKPAGQGTGLGLAICEEIIKQHGGHISVRSEPGVGTSFSIALPQFEGNTAEPEQPHTARLMKLPTGHETVLLVEDEPSVLALTARLLRRQG